MFGNYFGTLAIWEVTVQYRDNYYAKKNFECLDVRILVEKWNTYDYHIFPRSLLHKCWLESIFFKYPIECKIKLNIFIIFNYIKVNFWLLWAHPLMTSIILHSPRPNTQEIVSYVLGFCVSADVHISQFWGAEKHDYFTSLHFAPWVIY